MKETNDACADIVLLSNAVFSGAEDEAAPGFVAVCGERISAVGPKSEALQWIGPETKVYELGDGLVMPGIHDNHVFLPDICRCIEVWIYRRRRRAGRRSIC